MCLRVHLDGARPCVPSHESLKVGAARQAEFMAATRRKPWFRRFEGDQPVGHSP